MPAKKKKESPGRRAAAKRPAGKPATSTAADQPATAAAAPPRVKDEPAPPPANPRFDRKSAFLERGFEATVELLLDEIRTLYTADATPWIIGYSGGKDSTTVLQLVWSAIVALPPDCRRKPVHVISTDTMVENPVVSLWVARSLEAMKQAARSDQLPIQPRLLQPRVEDSFWVNLIGRGYPAPRHKFRWCTERLKIRPSNEYIGRVVNQNGQAILCLGARSAESARRASVLNANKKHRAEDRLSPSATWDGCRIYTPIEDWTNDDVWFFLMQCRNPWGHNNRDLLGMYAGASPDGECPLVIDDSTPSCGDSRFGCWVCTLVEKDKSMTAMVQNDEEKRWMEPLLDLRNLIDFREDGVILDPVTGTKTKLDHTKRNTFATPVGTPLARFLEDKTGESINVLARDRDWERHLRDFRRLHTGNVQFVPGSDREVRGPYIAEARACWLRALLTAQQAVRELGPPEVARLELITLPELEEIRRIWVIDKHEMEDLLPKIYQDVTGGRYPGRPLDDNLVLGEEQMNELAEITGGRNLHYQLTRDLLSLTLQQRNAARRARLFEDLEKTIKRHFYDNEKEALEWNRPQAQERQHLKDRRERRRRERTSGQSLGVMEQPELQI